ncbi:MAG TPA: hydrolase [Prolixibacteraceae bacterium]|jgi:putative hydrolase of the HAD superfamily|nr:hydrolase [Prolixibacteraceae bacterium]
MEQKITTLFLDIGGVILTSGWDRHSRHRAVTRFNLDQEEMEDRHHLVSGLFDAGMLSMDEYLNRVIFHQKRNFSKEDFKVFMFEQSVPIEGSIEFFKSLKGEHSLKVIAVNNEARELNDYRIHKYNLDLLFDAFVSSCYVHRSKPDLEMWRMACGIAQASPPQILYFDDRLMFVEVARSLGITSYHFQRLDDAKLFVKAINFSTISV